MVKITILTLYMKRLFGLCIFITALLAVSACFAQQPLNKSLSNPLGQMGYFRQPGVGFVAANTKHDTLVKHRLLGYRVDQYEAQAKMWTLADSAVFLLPKDNLSDEFLTESWVTEEDRLFEAEQVSYFFNGFRWNEGVRQTKFYDPQGRIAWKYAAYWANDVKMWRNWLSTAYTYTPKGQISSVSHILYHPNGKRKNGSDSILRTYNWTGKIIADTVYSWADSIWKPYTARKYKYAQGHLTEVVTLSRLSGKWLNSTRQYFVYKNKALIERVKMAWNGTAAQWDYTARETFTYKNQRLTGTAWQRWDKRLNAWQWDDRKTYTWRGNFIEQLVMEEYVDGQWEAYQRNRITDWNRDNYPLRFEMESYQKSTWISDVRATIYWEERPLKVLPPTPLPVTITQPNPNVNTETGFKPFPNPAQNHIRFHIPDAWKGASIIQVYDMKGRLYVQEANTATGMLELDISRLPAGQYILLLSNGGKEQRAQFIKQ